jgi:hypothetical protein
MEYIYNVCYLLMIFYCITPWRWPERAETCRSTGGYTINILKVHLLEVVIYILMKIHGKHSIKKMWVWTLRKEANLSSEMLLGLNITTCLPIWVDHNVNHIFFVGIQKKTVKCIIHLVGYQFCLRMWHSEVSFNRMLFVVPTVLWKALQTFRIRPCHLISLAAQKPSVIFHSHSHHPMLQHRYLSNSAEHSHSFRSKE